MKSQILPIKRRPVPPGMFRRLHAVTKGRRKQRVAATASAREMEFEENDSRIAWALSILLLIHVVALCLIFIHHRFISNRPSELVETPVAEQQVDVPVVPVAAAEEASPQVVQAQLSVGEQRHIVRTGETYASIASSLGVSETDLRALNQKHAQLRAGLILQVPVKKVVVVATPPAEPVTAPEPAPVVRPEREEGLVAAIDTRHAPKATPVGNGGARSHVVERGESVWGISKRYGVSQEELMRVNGIKDVKKLFVGMKLRIP